MKPLKSLFSFMKRHLGVVGLLFLVAVVALTVSACFDRITQSTEVNQDQNHHNPPSPSPSPSASPSPSQGGGDNVVTSFAIFCYGFNTPQGKPEPNHSECALPSDYEGPIAVTASPKNASGIDVPFPGLNISWTAQGEAFAGQVAPGTETPFNRIVRAKDDNGTRRPAVITLTATYTDPGGTVHTATKTATIK
jgi:hypothetical protein